MPIKDLSDTVRLPRLGKIRLGIRNPEKGYPMKTDYFVCPDEVKKVFGEEPKELRILIPVEDEEVWATQYYKAYTLTHGLVCKGNGEVAMRMIDSETKTLPINTTKTCKMIDMACAGKACPEYLAEQCGEVMNLRYMLPEVPGLGVWQTDTGSINSILNINSCAKMIMNAFGRISMIPLKLTLEPTQVNNPKDGKKQTVYIMHLRSNVTMQQLAEAAREQAKGFLIEGPPDLEAAFDAQVEKDEDELFGTGTEADKKAKVAQSTSPTPATTLTKSKTLPAKKEVVLAVLEFKNLGEFYQACLDHFKLQKSQVDKEVPEYDLSNAGQRKKAWAVIIGVYGQKPPATKSAEDWDKLKSASQ